MNISFLDKSGDSRRLILIFPGWSCGKELYEGFSMRGWDVAVVENYESTSIDSNILHDYSTICLFAWSLGVYMASVSGIGNLVTSAFAFNGTLRPADDNEGIPLEIFTGTAEKLTPSSLLKFRRRMAGDSSVYKQLFFREFSEQETDILKQQLLHILADRERGSESNMPWKKVFISSSDSIFPPENMTRSWTEYRDSNNTNIEIVTLDEPHYVPLERIVRYSLPDPEMISRRFSDAVVSYDNNAVAQKELAHILASHLEEIGMGEKKDVLEIGCGTGLFTTELINRFIPSSLDLVDISDARPNTEGTVSTFFQSDAEEWMANSDRRYDVVVSSAAIQWFINLPLFISNVARALRQKGIFAFSTFLPGNLEELDTLRPSPIHYHSREEIEDFMSPYFDDIRVKEKKITLLFNTPSELFHHLRATGVGGSAPSGRIPPSRLKQLKSLTFRCAVFSGIIKNERVK